MLTGIRIIEIEALGPAPFAGMMLADMGAEVIKVQRPEAAGTPGTPERAILDRGKRSIVLDLKDAEDVATLLALIGTAEALIEGFRPGVMERLGLGPGPALKANPRLVYGRMTGWGQEGPMAAMAGHDMNYIGMAGALWHGGLPGQPPMAPPTLVGDVGGGAMYLLAGLLAGILNARTTGQGTVVDAAIFDGAASMMNLLMTLAQGGGFTSERGQSLLDGPYWCRSYRTRDGGFMSVQALEPKFHAILLERLGLAEDPAFSDQFDRALWPQLARRLEQVFATRDRDQWEALFQGTDACCAPVLTPQEAHAHPLNRARGAWTEVDGVLQGAPAPRFSTLPERPLRPAPERGADSAAIRAELRDQRPRR